MDELYTMVEKMLFSEKTIGEVIKEMSALGYSENETFEAIKEFDRKNVKTNSKVYD